MLFKGPGRKAGEVADIAVAAGIEVDGLADLPLRGPRQRGGLPVNEPLQLRLQRVLHFLADAIHQLDAVIIEGVMGGADHHAAVKPLRPGDIADAWRGSYVQQISVRPGGGNTRRQRVFKHIG